MTFRILVSDPLGVEGMSVFESVPGVKVDLFTNLSPEELIACIGDYDALVVRSGTTVTADVLEAGSSLIVIGRAGVGVDNVDIDAATRLGIAVTNTPDANTNAAAEQTIALMLAAARNTALGHMSMLGGEWIRAPFTGTEMQGKTLGVVGFGRIGRRVAVIAQALGMNVVAYDPHVSELVARDLDTTLTELDDVLAVSDVLTLHRAGGDGSPLIDEETLAKMKQGAILINAARGSLVDSAALAAALDSGHLKAAGIDVFEKEPPAADHPLVGHPNVVHTPHLGASTDEAQAGVSTGIADQVLAILRGDGYPNTVNIAVSDNPRSKALLFLAERIGRIQAAMAESHIVRVEIELTGDVEETLVQTAATGVLKGILDARLDGPVNHVSAPILAKEHGITVAMAAGISHADYPNLLSCRVAMMGHERTVSGVVFGETEPRIVRISRFHLDARPQGTVLLLLNEDVPGVVGKVGTVLGNHGVNIAEWHLGREDEGGLAISFVNLDTVPSSGSLAELSALPEVVKVTVVEL